MVQWPSNRNYNGTSYGFSFGYSLLSDSGSNGFDSATPYDTATIHGVYNNIDGSTTWANGVTHTLPTSFYVGSRPSWWNGSIPWPAIGPDVTGGGGPGGHAYAISNPAMNCFYNLMGGTDGGAGGPYTFNADSCYGSQNRPNPPTNLHATVQ
jgi:hypothetical protein